MAKEAYKRLGLSEVWMLVTPQNPHKSSKEIEEYAVRFELCQLIAKDHNWLKVSDFEFIHGTKYTAETLELLTKTHGDVQFVWLMGSENLTHFHKWQNWEKILKTVPIVTLYREETAKTGLSSPTATKYRKHRKKEGDSLYHLPNWRILFMPPHAGRATNIRQALQSGKKPEHLSHALLNRLKLRHSACKYFRVQS